MGGMDHAEGLTRELDLSGSAETWNRGGFTGALGWKKGIFTTVRGKSGVGHGAGGGRTSAASKKEMWDTIVIGVNACGNSVRDKYHCRKRFDDIRSKLKKKIQDQRVHATGTGGGPTPQRLILTPLEELLRPKLLTVVVEGLAGDRDIGIYPSQFPAVAPGGHVSPEMEQVSSPGSASSTLLEEHHGDEDDEYDEDDATEETEIQSCDHEEVPIETVVPPNRPSTSTYDAIVASEGKIVDAENRRHSDMMTVLERMIGLQEETVSQLAHLHRVFIEVPKQLQKINTSFEALVVQQTQANYWRMTNVPQFNTSQPGSVHAGQFSPHSSDIHSPGPNVTGQVADIAVQVPDDILPLPSVQIQQQTPTKEATKTKQDTHETDQPSLVQCLPTCSHVSLGTSPVREQSLPKSPVGESLPKSPVGESLPKSPVVAVIPRIVQLVKKLVANAETDVRIDISADITVTNYLDVLDSAYGAAESADDLYYKFRNSLQQDGEQLSEYLHRIEKLLHRVVLRGKIEAGQADKVRLEQVD
ncbi:uncharacterized protein LOC142486795 [Ascaphus truei]|uniref:uncharacterized protein LOC142486795 n=1 Tax=Ascaphus truei TaxID=8439 RepID=UPI003F5ACB13